jgi:SAM-dependent methyltransferase
MDKSEEGAGAGDDATAEPTRFGWEDWAWDASLFEGSAEYYRRGRIPYAEDLAGSLATVLDLDGHGRLLDVGCGPGIIALRLAHLFEGVIGLDPDAGMLEEAERAAREQGARMPPGSCGKPRTCPPAWGCLG